jgi:hypothetical protein
MAKRKVQELQVQDNEMNNLYFSVFCETEDPVSFQETLEGSPAKKAKVSFFPSWR